MLSSLWLACAGPDLPAHDTRTASSPGAAPGTADTADLSARLEAIERGIEDKRLEWRVPGAAVVIVRKDRVILLKGFGLRDAEAGLPVTPGTLFGLGSCTKPFTALAAVISADEGRLSLEDPPRTFLPYFKLRAPEVDAQVTLRDLLSHRSGLFSVQQFHVSGRG